jgi:uncharacterized protein YaeQ
VALTTIVQVEVTLSDVDRGVYETLELTLAQHPSESTRYLLTRLFAYCLSYEEGIAWSRGGLSDADEPPISIRDNTGLLLAWVDVGQPSAERLHKASKAARRVALFTTADRAQLMREISTRPIHKLEAIEVYRLEPAFISALEGTLARRMKLEIVRNESQLYVTVGGDTLESPLARISLVDDPK